MKRNSHKACRRYGIKLCQSNKCPVQRRNYPPGVHGPKGTRRLTEYGTQLAEKQKAKIVYGLRERPFRNYYLKAIKQTGDTGLILQQLLEMRLDNAIFRLGFAKTRAAARQMVSHNFFLINGKTVNIPSCQLKIKDEITIKPTKTNKKVFLGLEEKQTKQKLPSWLNLDTATKTAKVMTKPSVDDFEHLFNPRLIVEYYSK
ncbi:MAG: 30S ribosomal protein S4 [Candidatus Buchananbacteria bacterium RIFCSPHIGHO2_01_FULL_39_14]|uniref:Small ribosomal subunit protein uS4 n=2 Tax=Candidatus Buchananiibacteriota TaxID=1817903 RepID=A0A1G1YT08_9BACT|nr:MAG: 30S ribosomal protein S4 [Candidatus Buchananbacteria bacterium RIFCSPHIGHO2_01_FULL_39_14]OGY48882.1 MAG: 30S ribosomal protein S4 [Candidatus Buchananbacteria bacterium RIFCSPHIGHO2_02_FULL_39_17]OGY55444.1 MAG: 30S ribosomal protein S4 [Candidatus Buchananbacteria bacterium RIFCSPLOWO2_01_FULL_40_23b]